MISIRNLAVIGLGIALAGCQTDLGESIGSILKRDEPEPPAATGAESPPPAHGP